MSIDLLSIKYIYAKNIMAQHINKNNVELLSKKKIDFMIKKFDEKHWTVYRRQILREWYKDNMNYSSLLSLRYKRIVKRLGVDITYSSNLDLIDIERKIFAKNRQYKTIEVPYSNKDNKEEPAVFVFKDIRFYNNAWWTKLLFQGEMFITRTEIVFYDQGSKTIFKRIELKDISNLELNGYSVKIIVADKTFNLRALDNEVIMTSLERILEETEVVMTKVDNTDNMTEFISKTGESFIMPETLTDIDK